MNTEKIKESKLDKNYERIGESSWLVMNTHYDRKALYESSKEYIRNQYNLYTAVAVEVYFEGTWVVDMDWLEQCMDNNRHKITRI